MKNILTTLFVAFWCLSKTEGQNVGIGTATPLDKLHVNGITRTTGINLVGNSGIETGFGIVGKEINAGKIGYGLFTPNTLDILGGGNSHLDRKIRFWAEGGATFEGQATFNGNVGIGNFSPSQRLEVNGKVKITDDGNAPSSGTIRYNTTLKDFEGFNGTTWQSFTKPVNTEYWGELNRVITEIKPTNTIEIGTANPKCMFSDNYLAISHQNDRSSTTVTRFYKWEGGNWVYKTQVNADIIHTAPSSSFIRGRMTDDWFLFGNETANSVSIYKRNGEAWQFHSVIAEPTLTGFGDHYDIDGNKMVITTIGSVPGNNGRIFVYNFNGTGWVIQQTINDPTPQASNDFGTTISIKNNYLASSYGNSSTLNTSRIFIFNGTSFVWNSSITGNVLGKIFFEGSSVRIEVRNIDFITAGGGIYKIGTTGFWELIPNTFRLDPIPDYGIVQTNILEFESLPTFSLRKLDSGVYNELCVINYASITNSEYFEAPLLNKNCVIIPSIFGYKIFKKP